LLNHTPGGIFTVMSKVNNMSESEASWLAGYLDGDGCVTINKNQRATGTLRLSFDSCDIELLESLQKITGVGVINLKSGQKGKHRPAYYWRVSGKETVAILKQIVKYIRCDFKRRRAEIVIANADVFERGVGGGPLPPEVQTRRLKIQDEFDIGGRNRGSRQRELNMHT
jgi:hypothetical protein